MKRTRKDSIEKGQNLKPIKTIRIKRDLNRYLLYKGSASLLKLRAEKRKKRKKKRKRLSETVF